MNRRQFIGGAIAAAVLPKPEPEILPPRIARLFVNGHPLGDVTSIDFGGRLPFDQIVRQHVESWRKMNADIKSSAMKFRCFTASYGEFYAELFQIPSDGDMAQWEDDGGACRPPED